MKITRRHLRRLIEGMIGYPDKPPVNAKRYLSTDRFGPKLGGMLRSDEPALRNQGINLGATLGDDVLDVLDNMPVSQVDSFIDSGEGSLDKKEALFQSVLENAESLSPWRGKQVSSYLVTGYTDEFDVLIDGDILTDIYETIADGRDSEAKQIAYDYLNTGFLNSNPNISEWYNSNVASDQNFQGYSSFADFYFNQKIDDIHIYGILPYEFDVAGWNQYSADKIFAIFKKGLPRITRPTGPETRRQVYTLAKAFGFLSQGFGSHPVYFYFYDQEKGEIVIT
jgi:hypothetical protein